MATRTMKSSEVLRAARKLLADEGWSVLHHARNAAGEPLHLTVGPRSVNPEAASYSLYGAIAAAGLRAPAPFNQPAIWRILNESIAASGKLTKSTLAPIIAINNQSGITREDILAIVDDAIERLDRHETPDLAETRLQTPKTPSNGGAA